MKETFRYHLINGETIEIPADQRKFEAIQLPGGIEILTVSHKTEKRKVNILADKIVYMETITEQEAK